MLFFKALISFFLVLFYINIYNFYLEKKYMLRIIEVLFKSWLELLSYNNCSQCPQKKRLGSKYLNSHPVLLTGYCAFTCNAFQAFFFHIATFPLLNHLKMKAKYAANSPKNCLWRVARVIRACWPELIWYWEQRLERDQDGVDRLAKGNSFWEIWGATR